ncbi:MAG: SEC-C metal-binding domain-containing protein [Bryobacteraceae bacterium]
MGRAAALLNRCWTKARGGARAGTKAGRNDPCPCGSGKACHIKTREVPTTREPEIGSRAGEVVWPTALF